MKIHHRDVAVEVVFTRDGIGNWHFTYDIPNYRGRGETMRIESDMEFESEEAAQQHARLSVEADLDRNDAEIGAQKHANPQH